ISPPMASASAPLAACQTVWPREPSRSRSISARTGSSSMSRMTAGLVGPRLMGVGTGGTGAAAALWEDTRLAPVTLTSHLLIGIVRAKCGIFAAHPPGDMHQRDLNRLVVGCGPLLTCRTNPRLHV